MSDSSTVRHSIFDIEVTRPLKDLLLSSPDAVVAILVRRKDVPIGFWLQESNGSGRVSAEELAGRIGEKASGKIVAEAIREEITPTAFTVSLPFLTIAICTKDRPEGVERLLQSLRGQETAVPDGSAGLEILLVDNAPSDERTLELAKQHPEVRYVREGRPGLNFARNRALREAQGKLLAFLDDDVIVDLSWMTGLAEAWAANPDSAAFTGQVLPMELETEAQVVFERHGGFRRGFDRVRYGPVLPGDRLYPGGAGIFGAGANMTFSTEVLRELGGFDEALDTGAAVPGGGDLDMFYRIIRGGLPLVYEPRFLVFHQHRREMELLLRQCRRSWGLGFMCYVSKCLKTDPERRVNLLRLIRWWYANETLSLLRHFKKKLQGRPHIPPVLFLGEIWGGTVGLLGGYRRSQRRIEEIRKRFP
jgi:glycosyltransferase involved in cell wall biosynthesis